MPAIPPPPPFPPTPNSCLACLQKRKETVYACQHQFDKKPAVRYTLFNWSLYAYASTQSHACTHCPAQFPVRVPVWCVHHTEQLPANLYKYDQHMLQCRLPTCDNITSSTYKMSQQLCVNACFKYTLRLHGGIKATIGLTITQAGRPITAAKKSRGMIPADTH